MIERLIPSLNQRKMIMSTKKLGHVKVTLGLLTMASVTALAAVANATPVQSSNVSKLLSQAQIRIEAPSEATAVGKIQRTLPTGATLETLPGLKKGPIQGASDNGVCNGGGCAPDSLSTLDKISLPASGKLQPVIRPAILPLP
jgi:hypothetical protein